MANWKDFTTVEYFLREKPSVFYSARSRPAAAGAAALTSSPRSQWLLCVHHCSGELKSQHDSAQPHCQCYNELPELSLIGCGAKATAQLHKGTVLYKQWSRSSPVPVFTECATLAEGTNYRKCLQRIVIFWMSSSLFLRTQIATDS